MLLLANSPSGCHA